MIWKDMWEEMWLYGNPLSPLCTIFCQFIKKKNKNKKIHFREEGIIDAMYILIQKPSTRVSYNQTVLSLKYRGAFYISVAGFRIMMPCLTHFNSEHTFQHMTENASMLVLSGKRMHSA